MKSSRFDRTQKLIGQDQLNALANKCVAVFGLGGVGSYVAEALVRSGVGHLILVDKDVVDITNINRQLIALDSTIGRAKVAVAKERYLDINPKLEVTTYEVFYLSDTKDAISFDGCDYIVDAIDTVTAKILLIEESRRLNIPVITCLGTGNKLSPHKFYVDYIENTTVCPLAKIMRKELRKRGIDHIKVLYSKEEPHVKANPPASIAFVPSVAGLMIAGEVVKDLLGLNEAPTDQYS